jgi:NitT/TauT family transport system permease protein
MIRLYQVFVLAVVLGLWELASDRWIRELWISKPTLIGGKLIEWFGNGFIFDHIYATVKVAALGLVIGFLSGILLGLVIGLQPRLFELLDPLISGAYTLPRVALLPLLLVWFGFGSTPVVALVVLMVFFVIFFNTTAGIQSVERELVNGLRVMGATRIQIVQMVVLPTIVPFMIAALMIATPYALVGAIVGEIFIGNRGLGFLIVSSTGSLELTETFATCVVVTFLGLIASLGVAKLGPRLLGHSQGTSLDSVNGQG